jgi:hypothetical protein
MAMVRMKAIVSGQGKRCRSRTPVSLQSRSTRQLTPRTVVMRCVLPDRLYLAASAYDGSFLSPRVTGHALTSVEGRQRYVVMANQRAERPSKAVSRLPFHRKQLERKGRRPNSHAWIPTVSRIDPMFPGSRNLHTRRIEQCQNGRWIVPFVRPLNRGTSWRMCAAHLSRRL